MNNANIGDIQSSVGDLIKNLNKNGNTVVCDAKCQESGNKTKYYNEYLNSKNNLLNASDRLKQAEKKYYTKTNQTQYYNTLIYDRAIKHITKKMGIIESAFNENIEKLVNLVNMTSSQNVYRRNMNNVIDSYKYKQTNLEEKVDKTNNTKKINNRLAYFYSEKDESWALWINNYLWYIYILCIILILSKIVFKGEIKNFKQYPFIILLIVSTYIINYIYMLVINTLGHFKLDITYLVFISSFLVITFIYDKVYKFSFQ